MSWRKASCCSLNQQQASKQASKRTYLVKKDALISFIIPFFSSLCQVTHTLTPPTLRHHITCYSPLFVKVFFLYVHIDYGVWRRGREGEIPHCVGISQLVCHEGFWVFVLLLSLSSLCRSELLNSLHAFLVCLKKSSQLSTIEKDASKRELITTLPGSPTSF